MRSRGFAVVVLSALAAGAAAMSALARGSSCPADITDDGTVDGGDLGVMLGAWGPCIEGCFGCLPDLDGDCFVDGADLGTLLGAWGRCQGAGFDIAVEQVTVMPTPIVENQTASIAVDVSNSGDRDRVVILVVTAGVASPSCAIRVPAQGFETCTVAVAAPPLPDSCGEITALPVSACAIVDDDDASNNCLGAEMDVIPSYADLVFEILGAPESAEPCAEVGWTVLVTNVGTGRSESLCFETAMDCAPGEGVYECDWDTRYFLSGVLLPMEIRSFNVLGYVVPCAARRGTQWIKVEFDTASGCIEPCGNGNYAEAPVQVGG